MEACIVCRRSWRAGFVLALLAAGCGAAGGEDLPPDVIRIDASVHHQTIDGFGAFGGQRPEYKHRHGPLFTPGFVDMTVNDLGLSVLRTELPVDLEPANENDDPNVTDLAGFNLLGDPKPGHPEPLGMRLPYLTAMREAGVETFLTSAWSPPAWMKHNGNVNNNGKNEAPPYQRPGRLGDNQLREDAYEEFAELWVAYIRILERDAGIRLDAVSLQNEPRFSLYYRSAVYDGEAMRDLIKVVGARFAREGIGTRIILPEDVANNAGRIRGYVEPTLEDPEARKYVRALAVHGYGADGKQPMAQSAAVWEGLRDIAADYDLPLWVTETSGYAIDWPGAMHQARAIDIALRHGNASMWLYFRLGELQDSRQDALTLGGDTRTRRFDVARHYFREIRPGAVRIAAETTAPGLYPLAFRGPSRATADPQWVLTVINADTAPRTMRIEGEALPDRWQAFRSSEQERGVVLGTADRSDGFTFPPLSVTTLTAPGDAR